VLLLIGIMSGSEDIKCCPCEAVLIVIAQYRTNVVRDRECLGCLKAWR
jgi:hypothetical protein